MEIFTEIITSLGFPIAICIALFWFIHKIYTDTTNANKENMAEVQARQKEREERLYNEIAANREVIAQAIATITLYADRLGNIERDIGTIKTDISQITEHIT